MSIVETLHAQRKARLARLRTTPSTQQPERPAPKIVPRPKPIKIVQTEPVSDFVADGNPVPIDRILAVTCKHFNVAPIDVISGRRTANLIRPRHIVYYLCKKLTLRSLPVIGKKLGGRDHTTILHGIRKVERQIANDAALREAIEELASRIGGTDLTHRRKPNTRLTEAQVREIRASTESQADMARRFGISHGAVWCIIEGRTWKHLI